MNEGLIIRALLVAFGALILTRSIFALASRKLTEQVCVVWGFFAAVSIVAGLILHPDNWREYISIQGLVLVVIIIVCFTYGIFLLSERVSELSRKSSEMAMNISLLNAENEALGKRLEELESQINAGGKDDDKNSLRD
ncbi:MAG: hypothetical protein MJ119_02110 [Lachnospiraceae bacterium]|nr:hypothetical protein [Lachnospiraceae bacterium]